MTVVTNQVADTAARAATGDNFNASYALPLSSVLRASRSSSKVSVPVTNYSFFAQFRHFTPVPAGAGDAGFSIARLRVLDILIDRLAELQSRINEGGLANAVGIDGSAAGKAAGKAAELRALVGSVSSAAPAESSRTRAAVEQLIAQYSATLQTAVSAAKQRPYSPTIPQDTGRAVILSAQA